MHRHRAQRLDILTAAPSPPGVIGALCIEWDFENPSGPLGPLQPAECETLTYTIDVDPSTQQSTEICNEASLGSEDMYEACGWDYIVTADCFILGPSDENRLLKNCCSEIEVPCDIASKFPLPPSRSNLPGSLGAQVPPLPTPPDLHN